MNSKIPGWILFVCSLLRTTGFAQTTDGSSQATINALPAEVALETRTFPVLPGFRRNLESYATTGRPSAPNEEVPKDPFAPAHSVKPREADRNQATGGDKPAPRRSTRALLEELGIDFPSGATAFLDSSQHVQHMRNTATNLDIVQALLDGQVENAPRTVVLTAYIIQAPGSKLRPLAQASLSVADQSKDLQQFLADAGVAASAVRILRTSQIETKSGQRAALTAGTERTYTEEVAVSSKGASTVRSTNRLIGFSFEVDPTVDSYRDEVDVNLAIKVIPSAPMMDEVTVVEPASGNAIKKPMPEFVCGTIQTSTRLRSGQTRLLGVWKPLGANDLDGKDLLQGLFLTAEIVIQRPVHSRQDDRIVSDLTTPNKIIRHRFSLPNHVWLWGSPLNDRTEKQPPVGDILRERRVVLPKGSRVEVVQGKDLIVHADLETMDVIQGWVDEEWASLPKNMAATVHIVRGPGQMMRSLLDQTRGRGDHSSAFNELTAAAAKGTVRFVSTTHVAGKSGEKIVSHANREHSYLSDVSWNHGSHPNLISKVRPLGMTLEMDPAIGEDGETLFVDFTVDWQTAPLTPWRESFADPASGKEYEFPREDVHHVKLQSATVFLDGSTKIIGAWHPKGSAELDGGDVMEIALMTVHVVKCIGRHDPDYYSETFGSEKSESSEKMDDTKMVRRVFRVTPDFLSGSPTPEMIKTVPPKFWALEILKAQGIPFPEGSSVIYVPGTNRLIVVNTRPNLDLIEAFTCSLDGPGFGPKSIAFNLHLFQSEGSELRKLLSRCASRADHSAELKEMIEAIAAGNALPLSTLSVTTKSGQRVTVEQVDERRHVTAIGVAPEGKSPISEEMRPVGTRMEIDPFVGADGEMLDINLHAEHSPAAPALHTESLAPLGGKGVEIPLTDFHIESIGASLTMTSGTARILAVWKPTGKPEFEEKDLLHIAILEAAVVPVEE